MMFVEAFGVIWRSLRDVWEELYYLVIANVAWFFFGLGLPLFLLEVDQTWAQVTMIVVICVLLPPITAAVYAVTSRVAHATTFHFSDLISAFKQHLWRSWLWFLANVAIVFIVYIDFRFYPDLLQNIWGVAISAFFVVILAFWGVMQLYFWPILLLQEKPNLINAWRNAAILILGYPVYALVIALFSALIWFLSAQAYFIPMGLITMILQGLVANNAVLTLLVKLGKIKPVRPPETVGRRA